MAITCKNTLVIDFSVLSVRPDADEIETFLDTIIHLDYTDVKNLQLHNLRNYVLIEMHSLEAAEKVATLHHLKHTIEVKKQKYPIPVHLEDSAVNVRIHDLPPDMPNAVVAEHMNRYGRVKSVARELWRKYFRGVPNGVRVVRIDLEKPIPSYIEIKGELTSVTYRGQTPTCRHCGRQTHPNLRCSEAAKRTTQSISKTAPSSNDSELPPQQPTENQQSNDGNEIGTVHNGTNLPNSRVVLIAKRNRSPSKPQNNDGTSSEGSDMQPVPDGNEQRTEEWIQYQSKKYDKSRAKKKIATDE